MSDLSTFAWHCRAMASAEHTPGCVRAYREALRKSGPKWGINYDDAGDPVSMAWLGTVPQPEPCPGCVTDDDRARWAALADEVEAYMDPGPTLWVDDGAGNGPETRAKGSRSAAVPDPAVRVHRESAGPGESQSSSYEGDVR